MSPVLCEYDEGVLPRAPVLMRPRVRCQVEHIMSEKSILASIRHPFIVNMCVDAGLGLGCRVR